MHCATERACAFGETIARFRPSVTTIARLCEIRDDDPIDESLLHNKVPTDWRFKRRIGWLRLDPALAFVDVNHASTLTHLRHALAPTIEHLGLSDLDLSMVSSQNRRLTQEIARYIYEYLNESGSPRYAGIRYTSRLHNQWECWAVFYDRLVHLEQHAGSIFPDDPGLIEAVQILGLEPPDPF